MTAFNRAGVAFGAGAPVGAAFGVASTPFGGRTLTDKETAVVAGSLVGAPAFTNVGVEGIRRQAENIQAAQVGEAGLDAPSRLFGEAVQRSVGAVDKGLNWFHEHTLEPVTDYYDASNRWAVDQHERKRRGMASSASAWWATVRGTVPGLAFTDDEFRENYWNPAREATEQGYGASAWQTAWEQNAWGGDRGTAVWNAETGRMELPLIDDPELMADREAYFNHGVQRWTTGVGDAVFAVALDPSVVALGGAGKVAAAARTVSVADVAAASAGGRGVRAAERVALRDADNAGDVASLSDEAAALEADRAADAADAAIPSVEESLGRNRVQRNIEKLTDFWDDRFAVVREGGDGAGLRAEMMNDPIVQRMGPERGMLMDAAAWVSSTFTDDVIRKGVMDDVWLAGMGDRKALQRIEAVNERMALDLQGMVTPDGKAVREAIDANPYLTTGEKWNLSNSDTLWQKQKRLIEEDVAEWERGARDRLPQVLREGRAGLDEVGESAGDVVNLTDIPLTTGLRRRLQTSRTINSFQSLPGVQVLSGTHVPHTLNLNDDMAVELFDKHVRTSLSVLGRRDRNAWADEIRDQFAVSRDQLAQGTSRGQRADIVQKFNRTMTDNLAAKMARSKVGRRDGWDKNELRQWITLARRQWQDDVESATSHMRQAVSKGERVGITDTGQPFAIGSDLHKAISQGQFEQVESLVDWSRMERMLKKKFVPGQLSDPGETLGMHLMDMGTTALADFTNAWKFAALLRPVAYPLRVQQDTQLRNMATMGVLESGLNAFRGTGNLMANLSRVDRATARVWERKVKLEQEAWAADDVVAPYRRPDGSLASDAPEAAHRAQATLERAKRLRDLTVDDYRDLTVRGEAAADRLEEIRVRRAEISKALNVDKPNNVAALAAERTALWQEAKDIRAEVAALRDDLGGMTSDELFDVRKVRRGKTGMKQVQGSSARMDREGLWKSDPNQMDAYVFGDRDLKAALLPDARAHTYNLLAESGDSLADRLRRGHQDKGWRHLEYGVGEANHARWNQQVADQLNKHVRNDSSLMRMSVGASDEEIVQWMRSTPEGREYWETHRYTRDGDAMWGNEWELVGTQRQHFDNLVPNQRAADTLVARDVSADDVQYWWGEGDARPLVPTNMTEEIRLTGREKMAQGYDITRAKYFELMSTLPETYLGRHPQYNRFFQSHMSRLMRATNKDRYTQSDIGRLRNRARVAARKDMARIMFDTTHRSEIGHKLRFVAPFYSAWEDVMVKWSRIIAQRPEVAPLLVKGLNSVRSAFIVEDDDGNRILANGDVWRQDENGNLLEKVGISQNPNDGNIVLSLPSWVSSMTGADKTYLSRGSLNATFQGEVPWLPGLGPLVTVPMNEFMSGRIPGTRDIGPFAADDMKVEIDGVGTVDLATWLQPFGQTDRNVLEQTMPSWMGNMVEAVQNDSRRAQAVKKQLMDRQIALEESGESPRLTEDERMAKVTNQSRNWWWLRFVGSQVPVSTRPGTRLDYYLTEYRKYQDIFGLEAEDKFIEDYPGYADLTISQSFNETGIQASESAHKAEAPWRQQIAAYPEVGWALVGPEANQGEFSQAVYTNQLATPIDPDVSDKTGRRARTDDEIRTGAAEQRGWREWSKMSKQLDLRVEELGLTSMAVAEAAELRQIKDEFKADLMERNPIWARAYNRGFEAGSNPAAPFLDQMAAAMHANPKAAAGRQDLEALQEYLTVRDQVRGRMLEAGFKSVGETDSSEFRQTELYVVWSDFVEDLKRSSPAFSEMFSRARLEQDNLASDPLASLRGE